MNERELHDDLNKKFADILYSWKFPTSFDGQSRATYEKAVRNYFTSDPTAYHVLKALVMTSIQTHAWHSMSREQQDRVQMEAELAIHRVLVDDKRAPAELRAAFGEK